MHGRWILGESGAKKIEACAALFFPLCIQRVETLQSIKNFSPWMASPKLTRLANLDEFPAWEVNSIFSVDESLLKAQQFFLNLAIHDQDINITTEMRVFESIRRHPESIAIYKQALNLSLIWPEWQRRLLQNLVKSIVPVWVPRKGRQDGNSFTDPDFLGAIFTSIDPRSPYPELTLNITFAHELGHLCLMLYQFSGDLFFGQKKEVYSGVRKTNRPVVSAFHAAVALGYMISATRALLQNVPAADVSRSAYLNALLADYTENLAHSLKEIDDVEKSDLCKYITQDLWQILT